MFMSRRSGLHHFITFTLIAADLAVAAPSHAADAEENT